MVAAGEAVPWCKPIAEVSGRPVFAFEAAVPAYRDITEGDDGTDIAQLQRVLSACGYRVKVTSTFDAATAVAVRSLYSRAGYPVITKDSAVAAPSTSTGVTASGNDGEGSSPSGVAPVPALSVPRQVVVPKSELAFLAADGVVQNVLPLGAPIIPGPLFTVQTTGLSTTLRINPVDRVNLLSGMPVTVTCGGYVVELGLPELPEAPVKDDSNPKGFSYQAAIALPPEAPVEIGGSECTFSVAASNAEVYPIVVPSTAVWSDSDGSLYVLHSSGGGKPKKVSITVIQTLGGYSALTVTDEAMVAVGDEVVVGEQ